MSKPKLTEWFPGDVKPAREGVYQQLCGDAVVVGYQRWDGRRWYGWRETADEAERASQTAAAGFQGDPWRGLAQDPRDTQ